MLPSLPAQAVRAALAMCLLVGCSSATSDLVPETSGGSAGTGGGAAAGSTGAAGLPGTAGAGAPGSAGTAGSSSAGGGASSGGSGAMAGSGSGGATGVGGTGVGGSGDGPGTAEYGFNLRKPGPANLDWLCTFDSDASYVYVQLLQTGTERKGLAETPVYAVELAQVSVSGNVSELANVSYDYGGGHHNDALSFDFQGATHSYYHSSFGFGFRSCQPMDCRNVYALGTTTLQTEGCGATRALPETCVTIEPDGTHAALQDKFAKCPGDSR